MYIAAVWEEGLKEYEPLDDKLAICRIRLQSRFLPKDIFSQAIKYLEWMLKIYIKFRKEHPKIVHCHDLQTLPIGILFKYFQKSLLIYDSHELATEHALTGIRQYLGKILERSLIYSAQGVIVVSDSIAKWYNDKYSLKQISIVKNVPEKPHITINDLSLKSKFGIKDDEILFIYQGGLSSENGVNMLLQIFSQLSGNKHIVFMGCGELEKSVKAHAAKYFNIHFQPAVKHEEVILYTKTADIGISVFKDICLSYYYSLPNKVFEYILGGLPLIVSDFPEMAKLIDDNSCGWKVIPEEGALSKLIANISLEDMQIKKINARKIMNNYGWDIEAKILIELYERLISRHKSTTCVPDKVSHQKITT